MKKSLEYDFKSLIWLTNTCIMNTYWAYTKDPISFVLMLMFGITSLVYIFLNSKHFMKELKEKYKDND